MLSLLSIYPTAGRKKLCVVHGADRSVARMAGKIHPKKKKKEKLSEKFRLGLRKGSNVQVATGRPRHAAYCKDAQCPGVELHREAPISSRLVRVYQEHFYFFCRAFS